MAVIALRESEDIEWVDEDLLDNGYHRNLSSNNQHAPVMPVVTLMEHLSSPLEEAAGVTDWPSKAETINQY